MRVLVNGLGKIGKNIFRLAEIIMQNSSSILENSIIEIFDWWTEHYHENRLHVEGWKTNSAWKVNKKMGRI